jgi:phospholipid/cholesterol/gamma-HCH transport system substrate-binding protein
MAKRVINNIKLGIFVLAGLLFLILLLYMIGKNRSMFSSNFVLKARFENIQGLKSGNNVRYAGIEVGTVKRIEIINDTTIEVVMIIDDKMKSVIHKNAIVSIATDGFVGNKVVNIVAGKTPAEKVVDGDLLVSKRPVDTDDLLRTFSRTNKDLAVIADNLKSTISKINNSKAFWNLLNDDGLPKNIRESAINIKHATAKANDFISDLHGMVADVRNGKGSLGTILNDTSLAYNLNEAILKIQQVGEEADTLATEISVAVNNIDKEINRGKGTVHALLKDSVMAAKLSESLANIQKGTDGFNQVMDAVKHSFLFKGYFRKLEKQKQKQNPVKQ